MKKTFFVIALTLVTSQSFALVKTQSENDSVRILLTGDECKQEQERLYNELKAAKRIIIDKRDCAPAVLGGDDIGSIVVLKQIKS